MATPGIFAGLLADELDVDVGTVAQLQRALREGGAIGSHGRGRAATHVTLDEGVQVLVALCAHLCGATMMEAGNIARRIDPDWSARLRENVRLGQSFIYSRSIGDRCVSMSLSSRAIQAIRDAAGFGNQLSDDYLAKP